MNAKQIESVLVIADKGIRFIVSAFEGRTKIRKANYEAAKIKQDHDSLRGLKVDPEAEDGGPKRYRSKREERGFIAAAVNTCLSSPSGF